MLHLRRNSIIQCSGWLVMLASSAGLLEVRFEVDSLYLCKNFGFNSLRHREKPSSIRGFWNTLRLVVRAGSTCGKCDEAVLQKTGINPTQQRPLTAINC